jgi:hypothetical protein
MNPLISIFQQKIVQDIFQRVLYVWAIRHPATAYVQGINDLLTPFFVVFLTDYVDPSMLCFVYSILSTEALFFNFYNFYFKLLIFKTSNSKKYQRKICAS